MGSLGRQTHRIAQVVGEDARQELKSLIPLATIVQRRERGRRQRRKQLRPRKHWKKKYRNLRPWSTSSWRQSAKMWVNLQLKSERSSNKWESLTRKSNKLLSKLPQVAMVEAVAAAKSAVSSAKSTKTTPNNSINSIKKSSASADLTSAFTNIWSPDPTSTSTRSRKSS